MASPVKVLKAEKTTAEIRALGDAERVSFDVQLPLTLEGWDLVSYLTYSSDVIIASADGDMFIGEVADVDEERYSVTVELL